MEFTERTEKVPVQLENGAIIKIEVTETGTGREDVAFDPRALPFRRVTDALEGITSAISSTLEKVKPNKATVKFGMELAMESGQLTAGSGKANLEISLEWNHPSPSEVQNESVTP
jgi:hypothetical protein